MKKYKKIKWVFFFFLTCLLIIGIWRFSWWWIQCNITSTQDQGTFGDMFGAINALFSGLALAGVVFALIFQRQELQESIKAFQETAEASKGQERIQRISTELAAINSLLEIANEHVKNQSQTSDIRRKAIADKKKYLAMIDERLHILENLAKKPDSRSLKTN